jgi:hypothetical protein
MVLQGFNDLKPKRIRTFTSTGQAIVEAEDGSPMYIDLYLGASGNIIGKIPDPPPVDQKGAKQTVNPQTKWVSCDQG